LWQQPQQSQAAAAEAAGNPAAAGGAAAAEEVGVRIDRFQFDAERAVAQEPTARFRPPLPPVHQLQAFEVISRLR